MSLLGLDALGTLALGQITHPIILPTVVVSNGGNGGSDAVGEADRRRGRTGLQPLPKPPSRPLIEARGQVPLPPFRAAPKPVDQRSPLDLVDRKLIPQDLFGLQEQIRAAEAAHADARDIADIISILDDLDRNEA